MVETYPLEAGVGQSAITAGHVSAAEQTPEERQDPSILQRRGEPPHPPADGSTQRQVLYLGEINDSQQQAWRRTLEVFDEDRRQYCQLSLFPDDRPLAAGRSQRDLGQARPDAAAPAAQLWRLLAGMLAVGQAGAVIVLEQQAGRGSRRVCRGRSVLQLLVVNRLIDPGSELADPSPVVFAQRDGRTAGSGFCRGRQGPACTAASTASCDAQGRAVPASEPARWKTLFDASFDVLLYDLTSTYFEGLCEQIPKAKHGYSRDGRSDCRQVVIALVVTPDGLPLAYEVLAGNTTDKTTLRQFLARDRDDVRQGPPHLGDGPGHPHRSDAGGDARGAARSTWSARREACWASSISSSPSKPWEQVHEAMAVKLLEHEGEYYVLAHSDAAAAQGEGDAPPALQAVCPRAARPAAALRRDGRSRISRDTLLGRLAVLKKEAGRMSSAVDVHVPDEGQRPDSQNFHYGLEAQAYQQELDRDGSYILRTNAIGSDASGEAPADAVASADASAEHAGRNNYVNSRKCNHCERDAVMQ